MQNNNEQLKEKAVLLYNEVFKFAYSHTKDREAAQDIAQDVMEAVACEFETIHNPKALKQWVMQVTSNKMNSYFRELQKDRGNQLSAGKDNTVLLRQLEDTEVEILDKIVDRESKRNAVSALFRLEGMYQEVIRLHIINECSFTEIAKRQNSSVNTVKTRYFRGIVILRDEFYEIEKRGK